MNARLPTALARALAPFAPPQSVVHQIVSADEREAVASIPDRLAAKKLPAIQFLDDDIYEFDATTLELKAQHIPSCRPDLAYLVRGSNTGMPMLPNGNMLARGMRAKYLGLRPAAVEGVM